jgi:hypothetical protein
VLLSFPLSSQFFQIPLVGNFRVHVFLEKEMIKKDDWTIQERLKQRILFAAASIRTGNPLEKNPGDKSQHGPNNQKCNDE